MPDQNGQKPYPFSGRNGAKTITFVAPQTYMACISEYPTPSSLPKNALYLVYWISQSKGDALGITLGSSVKQTSTWSKAFYCLICLDATTFVLPGVFTLTETICPKLLAEALPMNEKHPLPVDMRHFLQTNVARLHIPEETSYVGLSLSLVQMALL